MLRPLLVGSLLLNVCLLVVVAHAFWQTSANAPGSRVPAVEFPGTETETAPDQNTAWDVVVSEDYLEYAENLREQGVPERLVQQIIIAEVDRPFEAQLEEVAWQGEGGNYWATDGSYDALRVLGEETVLAIHALRRERKLLLRSVLGPEARIPAILPDIVNPYLASLSFLPEDKRWQVFEQEELLMAKTLNPAEGRKHAPVMQEKEQAIAAILSAEEKEEYDLRMSSLAIGMRRHLRRLDLTEYEFREIFRAQRDFTAQRGDSQQGFVGFYDVSPGSPAGRVLHENLMAILGNVRYSEYQRVQDHRFVEIARNAEWRGLDESVARYVYAEHKRARRAVGELAGETGLTAEQHEHRVQEIAADLEASLRGMLGVEEYDLWGGRWVSQIVEDGNWARQALR